MLKLVNPATEEVFETLEESSPGDISSLFRQSKSRTKKMV